MWGLLVLAVLMSGPAMEAFAADPPNHAVSLYAYSATGPLEPLESLAVPTVMVSVSARAATLPRPYNGVCVDLCRLFELMWRLERPGQVVPD